jgi:hypothetical protein
MSWKEDFEKFQSSHSKLLYMIHYFTKEDELTEDQRTKLKEYIILEDEKIFEILNEFETNFDEQNFLSELKRLYDEEIKFSFQENVNTVENDKEEASDCVINLKKPLSVNTNKSFLNNAMSSIHKRGSVANISGNNPKQDFSIEV